MAKYILVSQNGQKINNCLVHSTAIVKAIFDNTVDEDDLNIMEDCFTTSLDLTESELNNINLQLATAGVKAIIQN